MKKKIVSTVIAAALVAACFSACGKKTSYKPLEKDDDTVYTIGLVSDSGNEDMETGFNDALTDTFGKGHFNIIKGSCTSKNDTDSIQSLIDQGSQLIVIENWKALDAAYTQTQASSDDDKIPVVSTGVGDIAGTLGIEYNDADNRTTGVNVTGVIPYPSVSAQLSEMIEATKKLRRVGIIYSPENRDAVKNNRILENYLTEAGIGYREYILPTSSYKSLMKNGVEAQAIKTSDDEDPTEPQISDDFSKSLYPGFDDSELLDWEKQAKKSLKNASDSKIINTAVKQCDAIYISSGFDEKTAKRIARAAKNGDKVTYGSDAVSGKQALVTLWADPYDSGYRAGEMAYQILVNKQDPGDISVSYQSDGSFQKLYNGSYAEVLGITFPKSFNEYSAFMKSYVPGTHTDKVGTK
ncbi:MAG: ABC transporter substrate binding protein [Lachnospiraceae bacterium]|nr:ABC transporter substrate binding protein [Lachnospiraceae bacterium]